MGEAVQLEATLCYVDSEGEASEGSWGSDDVGGFQCYIAADEEATAAAETYRSFILLRTAAFCSSPV